MNVFAAAINNPESLIPFFVFAGVVVFLAVAMLTVSYILGERHQERDTNEPYESGIQITGSARLRFTSQFYLVAMFFVIFDLEAAFIITWAVAFKQLGWAGFIGAMVFIGILAIVLVYEWRIGGLDFGPGNNEILKAYRKKFKGEHEQQPKSQPKEVEQS